MPTEAGTGEELIFGGQDTSLYTVSDGSCTEPEGLKDYVGSLELMELTEEYDFDLDGVRHRVVIFDAAPAVRYMWAFTTT